MAACVLRVAILQGTISREKGKSASTNCKFYTVRLLRRIFYSERHYLALISDSIDILIRVF
jgi:hypothetical protein